MQNLLKPLGKALLLLATVALFLSAVRPVQALIIGQPIQGLIGQNLAAVNAKKCLKNCAATLVTCFTQNPATLSAPVSPLDSCRTKVNVCATACNVPNTWTVSCEDRCATSLESCLIAATSDKYKTICHASNKSCLLKACNITVTQLASDYCSKQCGRGYDICAVDNGIPGVACQTLQTACVKACPTTLMTLSVGTTALVGTRFTGTSPTVLKTNFNTILTGLRALSFNFKSFSSSLKQWSAQTCPDSVVACENEYKLCSANADQAMDTQLLAAKNQCVQTCEESPAKCFGIGNKVCSTGQVADCTCSNGTLKGTRVCKADGSGYGMCDCTTKQVCAPKTTASCTCPDGANGLKTCADDGSSYGSCVCKTLAIPLPPATPTSAPPPPPPPPQTPQNCYAQGFNYCPDGSTNQVWLCALQYPGGNWWQGAVESGCGGNQNVCPCPTTPPAECAPGQVTAVSCMDPVEAPNGGIITKTCMDGAWVSSPCIRIPWCDEPHTGQCLERPT